MTVAHHEEPNYMGVFWWLLVLTILEICVIYAPMAHLAIVLLLIGMALTKASLVAMYYMHLALEKRTLGIIAVIPLILCVFLVFALTPDLGAVVHQSPKIEAASEGVHGEH
jgi:cytochrome c oxidase subunit 4